MKALLLNRDHSFDPAVPPPANAPDLTRDLELDTLFQAMAAGDQFLFDVARSVVLAGLNDVDAIRYRQDICRDCLKNPALVSDIYSLAVAAIEQESKQLRFRPDYTAGLLRRSKAVLEIFGAMLWDLRGIAERHAGDFSSEGFKRLFAMLRNDLDDAFFDEAGRHLAGLDFRDGVLMSAALGPGNRGADYVLRRHSGGNEEKQGWLRNLLEGGPGSTITVEQDDEDGLRALSDLRDDGLFLVARALARSAERILDFFKMLRTELAFYLGCVKLHERLSQQGMPVSFPTPLPAGERNLDCSDLRDVTLALASGRPVVGNDVKAGTSQLVVITGANQGGKSTFLRSLGLAQLMMQAGMFVPAATFTANVCDGLFTHFRREEDATMESGKFDEELGRISAIVDAIAPDAMLLLNESFAATNEREGSEIARQVVRALLECGVKVVFVTHLYEFARSFHEEDGGSTLFLRAERRADGTRSFKLIEGEPLATSYGTDLYRKIFEAGDGGQAGD